MAREADAIWSALDAADWLEAFAAHPRIGAGGPGAASEAGGAGRAGGAGVGSAKDLAERHRAEDWSANEQARVADATPDVRERLARRNREYEARFGYIFIVCATGRSAGEMLGMLESRMRNGRDVELRTAADEQRKISRLRLEKLLQPAQDTHL
jgi:2-oxo-4-hydroxy-4-carboxy-5-ureidoimidazoline decarboxylase